MPELLIPLLIERSKRQVRLHSMRCENQRVAGSLDARELSRSNHGKDSPTVTGSLLCGQNEVQAR